MRDSKINRDRRDDAFAKSKNLRRTAIIHYLTEEGQDAIWQVACTNLDDESSMREHAHKFFPSMAVTTIEFDEGT